MAELLLIASSHMAYIASSYMYYYLDKNCFLHYHYIMNLRFMIVIRRSPNVTTEILGEVDRHGTIFGNI